MTRTLILTRHAKSSWSDPLADDYERTLNARGRQSATAIGEWLVERGHIPDQVIVSGARRTVETWEGINGVLKSQTPQQMEPALYHAGVSSMLTVLQGAAAPTVMMIGHNPGIGEFAGQLVRSPPDHPRFEDYPTGATTVMTFDLDTWQSVRAGIGTVVDFLVPRDLMD